MILCYLGSYWRTYKYPHVIILKQWIYLFKRKGKRSDEAVWQTPLNDRKCIGERHIDVQTRSITQLFDIFSVARTAYSDTDSIRKITLYLPYDFLIESVSEYVVRATLKMSIRDRLRTVNWSDSSHPTGVVYLRFKDPTFPLQGNKCHNNIRMY